MRLSKTSKIELIASCDETRPHLLHPYLDVDAKVLVATDGHRMVKHPVIIDDGDVSAFVSKESIKAARKLATKVEDLEINVGAKTLRLINGMTMPTPPSDCPFPPYDKVIPNYSGRTTVTVCLDAKYLLELCRALGGSAKDHTRVRLTFPIPDEGKVMLDPIVVEYGGSDAVGILMPSRT